ncbi:MAG: energy-coupling factor transporter ATPase [Clostridia bacterium]|nr:energy-coupling factor transporter ATPase [Clostridia bacterium]MBR6334822.1 energy-coupling factor transporter ATPase [Clostridia bacterium]
MSKAIEITNLTHKYTQSGAQEVVAVSDVNLSIEKGESIGIIGHTGSGKSTLISHFNGLLKPTSGDVVVDGTNIWADKETLRNARFKVGLCFQYPEYQLFEETVYKDIAFGPKNMKLSPEEIDERVLRAAEFTGISKSMLEKSPFELSGGEKRRAAIAGVIAMNPEVIVLDEPAAGLDPAGRKSLIDMIKAYRDSTGSTVIMVTHNMEDIARIAERLIVINRGKIALDGTVDEVFSRSDDLVQWGLKVPEITEVFTRLHNMGCNVPRGVYTVDEGVKILSRVMRGGAGLG